MARVQNTKSNVQGAVYDDSALRAVLNLGLLLIVVLLITVAT